MEKNCKTCDAACPFPNDWKSNFKYVPDEFYCRYYSRISKPAKYIGWVAEEILEDRNINPTQHLILGEDGYGGYYLAGEGKNRITENELEKKYNLIKITKE